MAIKILAGVVLTLALVMSTGCSAFVPHNQTINVICEPADAVLTINGERYDSPVQVSVKRNRDVSLQCYKEGYVPYQRTIGHHFNTTGVLDAAGGVLFLISRCGISCPGRMVAG